MRQTPLPKIEDLPPTIGVELANGYLGIGRSTGYALLQTQQYPVRVLRIGRRYRVVTSDLRRVLEVGDAPPGTPK